MGLFERLSDVEKDMMERYIDAYAFNDYGERSTSLEYIMRVWNESKVNLFNMFGEQMILSKEVLFEKGADELSSEIERIKWNGNSGEFCSAYFGLIDKLFEQKDNRFYLMRGLLNSYLLVNNAWNGETFMIEGPKSGKMIKVQDGTKITRVLGKIANEYDLPCFEAFRIAHSMVLNQKKLKGNLCLSIHPLDYMTMSDNESDWTSCMSWNNYGCYRQGTVEMMNSDMVIVAYLTAKDDMFMPGNYRWNNKKWRQLFIVNPNMIGNIKAYPYRNDDLTKEVLSWLKELAEQAHMGTYTDKVISYDAYNEFAIEELDNRSICVRPHTEQMYNDFNDNQWGYFNIYISAGDYRFTYSGDSECMSCGATDCYFDGESHLTCEDCEPNYHCEWCDESYYSDEGFEWVDDCYLCPNCLEDNTDLDFFTDERHLSNGMYHLKISFDGGETLYDTDFFVHESTLCDDILGEYFTKLYHFSRCWERAKYFVDGNSITQNGLKYLGFKTLDGFKKDYLEHGYGESIKTDKWEKRTDYNIGEPDMLKKLAETTKLKLSGEAALAF